MIYHLLHNRYIESKTWYRIAISTTYAALDLMICNKYTSFELSSKDYKKGKKIKWKYDAVIHRLQQ